MGVRLDAAAYYGKDPARGQPHHPDSVTYARQVAAVAFSKGLRVFPQLDCDPLGRAYFSEPPFEDTPVLDYSFPALLAHAVLTSNVSALSTHLAATTGPNQPVVCAPRTHDGIFLRSSLLPKGVSQELSELAGRWSIRTRLVNDDPYELNCSLPYLYGQGVSRDLRWKRLRLAIATSCLISGWGYIYLPLLFGHCPEDSGGSELDDRDPRLVNRLPMPPSIFEDLLGDPEVGVTVALVALLSSFTATCKGRAMIKQLSDSAILIEDPDAGLFSVLNFSHSPVRCTPPHTYGDRVIGGKGETVNGFELGVWA